MHNLFFVYFVNLNMFWVYLGPSSGGTAVCILSVVLVGLESNPPRTTDSYVKRIISTNCCIHTVVPPDDGPRYARNVWRLTKYTNNKLCIKLVFLYKIFNRPQHQVSSSPYKTYLHYIFKYFIQKFGSSTWFLFCFHKNVKWSHYRPDVAQRVGRGIAIALIFRDRGTRRGWVVSSTPRPHVASGKDPVPILQEAG